MDIYSINRVIEYENGYLKLQWKKFYKTMGIFVKRNEEDSFYYVKNMDIKLEDILTCDVYIQEFVRNHALGEYKNENLSVCVIDKADYHFSFTRVLNDILIELSSSNSIVVKQFYSRGNYYNLFFLISICKTYFANQNLNKRVYI